MKFIIIGLAATVVSSIMAVSFHASPVEGIILYFAILGSMNSIYSSVALEASK